MSNEGCRAFSLIETMVAGAILGLISTAVLSTMWFAAAEVARTRVRAVAAADAQAQLDRIVIMTTVVRGDDAVRCALLQVAGAPMDTTTGGTLSGTCPLVTGDTLVVTGIPIPSSTLKRSVTLAAANLGNAPGLLMTITVDGDQLPAPITISTHVKR